MNTQEFEALQNRLLGIRERIAGLRAEEKQIQGQIEDYWTERTKAMHPDLECRAGHHIITAKHVAVDPLALICAIVPKDTPKFVRVLVSLTTSQFFDENDQLVSVKVLAYGRTESQAWNNLPLVK